MSALIDTHSHSLGTPPATIPRLPSSPRSPRYPATQHTHTNTRTFAALAAQALVVDHVLGPLYAAAGGGGVVGAAQAEDGDWGVERGRGSRGLGLRCGAGRCGCGLEGEAVAGGKRAGGRGELVR